MRYKTLVGELDIKKADNFLTRLKGLLGSKELPTHSALLISPCNSVHTLGMRYSIDIICLDKQGVVLAIKKNLRPNRFFVGPKGTYEIVEFSAMTVSISESLIGQQFLLEIGNE